MKKILVIVIMIVGFFMVSSSFVGAVVSLQNDMGTSVSPDLKSDIEKSSSTVGSDGSGSGSVDTDDGSSGFFEDFDGSDEQPQDPGGGDDDDGGDNDGGDGGGGNGGNENGGCSVNMYADPSTASVGYTIDFSLEIVGFNGCSCELESATWSFGDGDENIVVGAATDVSYAYSEVGEYTASVSVDLAGDDSKECSCHVSIIEDMLPVAEAGGGYDYTLGVDEYVELDGSGSYDPDGDIVQYDWYVFNQWWYNKGAVESFAIADGYHGQETVKLKVIDDYGNENIDTANLVIVDPGCPIAEAGGPYTVTLNSSVFLDGSGSYDTEDPDGDIGSIASYKWKWNGIRIGTGSNPEIEGSIFGEAGTYQIYLVVEDDSGYLDSDYAEISVDTEGEGSSFSSSYSMSNSVNTPQANPYSSNVNFASSSNENVFANFVNNIKNTNLKEIFSQLLESVQSQQSSNPLISNNNGIIVELDLDDCSSSSDNSSTDSSSSDGDSSSSSDSNSDDSSEENSGQSDEEESESSSSASMLL